MNFKELAAKVEKEIAKRPEWQNGALQKSMRSTLPKPRPIVK